MLLNVGSIAKRAAALLDDPAASTFDKDYLLPFINQAWDDLAISLQALGLDYQEVVTTVAVPANTTDLSAFQADGQALESLLLPVKIEWKRAADEDIAYKLVDSVAELPDVVQGTEGHRAWEWRTSKIFITPSAIDTIVRIRFKAFSLDFQDPIEGFIIGVGNVLAYKVAELVSSPTVQNNAGGVMYFAQKGREAMDNFEVLCVKQKQRLGYRVGRQYGRSLRRQPYIARV